MEPRSSPCAERGLIAERRTIRATFVSAASACAVSACAAFAGALLVLIAFSGLAAPLHAQQLAPRRTLTVGAAPGCDVAPPAAPGTAPRNNAEARRLAAAGQEAALVGDQAAARDAFVRAAQLNPDDDRIAYDLARAHEELADTLPAIGAYCRYLTLAPAGTEAADVRARLTRLVPDDARARADEASRAFTLGLGFLDDRRYESAVRAFDEVVRLTPAAPEGYFNRGLARSGVGRRAEALADLEVYRAAAVTVEERVETARAIDVLRRPVYASGTALLRGVLPGFGQFYTARPVRGVVVLAAVAGATGAALMQQTGERTIAYVDPNGVPAPYTERYSERRWFVPGVAAATGLTLVAAIEAARYANRSQRGASIVAPAGARGESGGLTLSPTLSRDGTPGLRLSARF